MKRWAVVFVAAWLTVATAGCSSSKDKGINRDRDKPRAADKEK